MTPEQEPTKEQQRLLNMLGIKNAYMAHMGYDRWYMCHPNGPRTFVLQNTARSLVTDGYVDLEDSTRDGIEWYVLAVRQGQEETS